MIQLVPSLDDATLDTPLAEMSDERVHAVLAVDALL